MNRSLSGERRWFGLGLFILGAFAIYWVFFSSGLPVWWGPSASASEIAAGRELFEHQWSANDPLAHGDGLGPVYNAKSCAACHFQGGLGGGGELAHNAVAFEVLPRPSDPKFHTGTIHNFSIKPEQRETLAAVRKVYPTIPSQTIQPASIDPHCPTPPTVIPEFDPVRTESVQSTALFGAGWLDLIPSKAIDQNWQTRHRGIALREMAADFSNIPVGRLRRLADGRIGRFGWRGQSATLSEFVAGACSNELGLGTSLAPQAKPISGSASECKPDLDDRQFGQLVAFIKTLPKPIEVVPEDSQQREIVGKGKQLFATVGCAVCHVPDLGGVKGVYSDFLLYTLDDPAKFGPGGGYGEPPIRQIAPRSPEEPKPSEWKTPPLWGVADSAPYFHDGSAKTLADAIARHQGDAKSVTEAYRKLSGEDQAAVLAFLKSLRAPPEAMPLRDLSITKLTR